MPKYYVAGIPFDSEDCLKHYGVKGMKWNQHIFGIDANDKYINWLKDAGQNIGKFANNAANTVSNAATSAARAVGGALNKSANFVTGNQARQNLNNAKANAANVQSGRSKVNDAYARYDQLRNSEAQHRNAANGWRESQANRAPLENFGRNQDRINADNEDRRANRDANRAEIAKMKADRMAERQRNAETQARAEAKNAQQAYDRTLPGAAENAARGAQGFINSAGKWVSTAANDAKNWAGNAANAVGNLVSNKDEEQRMHELAKSYDPNTGKWRSEADRKAFYEAQDAYNNHPLTAIPNMARQIGTDISDGPVGEFARNVGNMATSLYGGAKDYIDRNITGAAQNRDADMLEDWIRQNREDRGAGRPAYQVDREADWSRAANEAREDAQNNTLFGRISNAANAVGNWVGDRAKDVGNVATDAWNGVTNAANDAGQWIGDRANDVGKAAESAVNAVGNAANDAGQWIGDRARDVGNVATDAWNSVSGAANQAGQWIGDRAKDVGNAAGSAVNAVGNAANDAGQWIGDRAKDVGNAASQAGQWIGDTAQKAWESPWVNPEKAVNVAGQWIGDRANEAGDAIGNAANGIRDWGGQAIKDAGNFLSEMANPHYNFDHLAENYRNYLNEHPENPQSPKHEEWLKEQIKNDPQLREYYERMMKHSDISDKPDGVGEAFWKNYIAHGGTREDYEREWR